MFLIFILSSFPAPEVVHKVPIWYHIKLVHIFEYGFLCFLFLNALEAKADPKKILLAVFLTTLYGITDEVHQMFVPNRTAQLVDIFTNFLGASVVGIIYPTFVPSKKLM